MPGAVPQAEACGPGQIFGPETTQAEACGPGQIFGPETTPLKVRFRAAIYFIAASAHV